jgi:hypothetical protein
MLVSDEAKEETMISNSDYGRARARTAPPSTDNWNVDADEEHAESLRMLDESVARFDCPAWWVARIERRLTDRHAAAGSIIAAAALRARVAPEPYRSPFEWRDGSCFARRRARYRCGTRTEMVEVIADVMP